MKLNFYALLLTVAVCGIARAESELDGKWAFIGRQCEKANQFHAVSGDPKQLPGGLMEYKADNTYTFRKISPTINAACRKTACLKSIKTS